MKVLITGSAGFLGRHFAAELTRAGHVAVGMDIANEKGRGSDTDALDFFRRRRWPTDAHYDLVLHLAAVSPHRAAIDGRALAVGAGNLALDSALFEWAARTNPGRVVYFSSSAAYPVRMQTANWRETNPTHRLAEHLVNLTQWGKTGDWSPDAIYGWVKLTGEHLADAYRSQGGAVTVVRPFSGYGADQSTDFPFGAFRDRTLRRDDPFTIWGDGEQVRDWVHVDDIVGAVLAACEQGVDGPVNICTGRPTSFNELATLFMVASGYCPQIKHVLDAPRGVAYRVGDPTLLNTFYTPRVSLEEGVRRALTTGACCS